MTDLIERLRRSTFVGRQDVLAQEAADEIERLRAQNLWQRRHLAAAAHALRSYQYDNASTFLAKEIADDIYALLRDDPRIVKESK